MNSIGYRLLPGSAYPLGATPCSTGVNFALFSAHAEKVELCLFDREGVNELLRFELCECTDEVWHGFVEGLDPALTYGYRIDGAFEPGKGHRFNPHKLLIDPYAKELTGEFAWHDSHFAYPILDDDKDLKLDTEDNAKYMPKARIVEPLDAPTPLSSPVQWQDTIIYEAHVKGLTKVHERLPRDIRGSYKALSHPDVIAYLLDLGVTSIELLPVHQFIDENFLVKKKLTNYWGYNTFNFFCPQISYACSKSVRHEFRDMVSALHEAGLEVILDVVYNHTAEGNHLGPTLGFRGIDNASYYGLEKQNARFYVNDTGCGNTLNMAHPRVRQLVLDSLRYWAGDMGVDGFRFDLATVMGREHDGFNNTARFFELIKQDPILATKKMIAEPWDIGPGGYQLGHFPVGWAEWNDKYRDTCRRFWRGDEGMLPEFARRIHGSNELFEHSGRRPSAGINLITAHDGFTLRDLVSYQKKNNELNKEKNQDGHNSNYSHNYGAEGHTDGDDINELRARQQRNLLATLLLSQGTPMITMGDELGRSQNGNNNAYCQDNELSWVNWNNLVLEHWRLKNFVRTVVDIRKKYSLFSNTSFIHKPDQDGDKQKYNIHWLNSSGMPMTDKDWAQNHELTLCWMLESIEDKAIHRCVISLFNAKTSTVTFHLPKGWEWNALLDTREQDGRASDTTLQVADTAILLGKSMVVLVGVRDLHV